MKRLSMVVIFALIAAVAGGGYWYWGKSGKEDGKSTVAQQGKDGKKGKGRGGGPIQVRTVQVKRQPMPVVVDVVGTVESEHAVQIRPLVGGTLLAVNFKEGDFVREGQVLFRIDSRPMQASLAQTRAAVARDEAQLSQARAQEQRLKPLADKEYITRQEYDVAATQAKSLEATLAANKAVVDAAQLQMSYSEIVAPISGRTGGLNVKAGNVVSTGAAGMPLVQINSTRPILVSFSVPQNNLDDIRQVYGKRPLKVEISPNGGGTLIATGTLVFIDNTVNPATGTILVKARVENGKEELWPGQFVAGRIILRMEDEAVTVPDSAVQPGQDTSFVFVVDGDRARMKPVKIDRQLGSQVVVASGLRGDEQIVVNAPPTLADGGRIAVRRDDAGKGGAADGKADTKADDTKAGDAPKDVAPGDAKKDG